jgi:hypothetical protein
MVFSLWPDPKVGLLASSAAGLISAYMAHRRGRNPVVWFFVGFAFGIAGIFAFFFAPSTLSKKQAAASPKPMPQPYLHGPIGKFWYYLDSSREQQGPMSYDAISRIWRDGKISPDTWVWHEELPDWKPLHELVRKENG